MFNLSRQEKIVLLFLIAILLIALGGKFYLQGKNKITIIPANSQDKEVIPEAQVIVVEESLIIHVAGAVNHPGVYQLPSGKRVIDALKMAGGETEKANLDAVNLAAPLYDGQKIIIPFIPENVESGLIKSDGQFILSQDYSNLNNSSLLNINNATSRQLEELPGIGSVLAERIIEYRESNGVFRNIEEIKDVPGIGEKKFEAIKELITVY
ncbi:MAG: helix-hairpin-helix domain-containing protein [Atribacterota bacterium]|nr:helix-hairpin-helix domain-containing protein [Atribacterota bacterium]